MEVLRTRVGTVSSLCPDADLEQVNASPSIPGAILARHATERTSLAAYLDAGDEGMGTKPSRVAGNQSDATINPWSPRRTRPSQLRLC